MKDQSREASVD